MGKEEGLRWEKKLMRKKKKARGGGRFGGVQPLREDGALTRASPPKGGDFLSVRSWVLALCGGDH